MMVFWRLLRFHRRCGMPLLLALRRAWVGCGWGPRL